jgi:hypothetical protein
MKPLISILPLIYAICSILVIQIISSTFSSQTLPICYIRRFRRGTKFHDAKLRKQASAPYMDTSTCLPFKSRHYPHLLSLCFTSSPGRGAVHSTFLVITGRSHYRNQHGSTSRQIAALKLQEIPTFLQYTFLYRRDRNMVCQGNVIMCLVAAMLLVITVSQAADVQKCKCWL